MAQGLADSGFEVTVCTEEIEGEPSLANYRGIPVRRFKICGNGNFRVGIKGDISAFENFLLESDPDILIFHCWDCWPTILAERIFPRLRGKKILVSHGFSTHLWQIFPRPPWGLMYWLGWQHLTVTLPWTLRKYDHVVFLSERRDLGRFFDHLVASLTGFKRSSVIPNGVSPSDFSPAPEREQAFRKFARIDDAPYLLCVANYSSRKNQEQAIEAFHRMGRSDLWLVLIGSEFNSYSEKLFALDARHRANGSPARVRFLEKADRSMVLAAYTACTAFVLSAKAETQPIVILEAMAAGKPFISTNTGCVKSLPGGIVVNSTGQMKEAMIRLLDDPTLAEKLGRKGKTASLAHFSKAAVVAAYVELIRSFK